MGTLGDRVKLARITAGYNTPEMCSSIAGLGSTTVRRWEDGASEPSASALRDFCELTKTSADWILGLSTKRGIQETNQISLSKRYFGRE